MKMYYGNTPVKKVNIKQFDVSTNDATVFPSDLQAGVTCYARGQKITGTGKCFEFATYGAMKTNAFIPVQSGINVIEVSCLNYPTQLILPLSEMKNIDFSTSQLLAKVIVDGDEYDITAKVEYGMLTISCSQTIWLQVFYGKDNYV